MQRTANPFTPVRFRPQPPQLFLSLSNLIYKKIFIRVDSAPHIGIGHFKRCLNIALSLRKIGIESSFIVRDFILSNYEEAEELGFEVLKLRRDSINIEIKDELSWLGVDWEVDAKEVIKLIDKKKSKYILVDHYGISEKWEKFLRKRGFSLIAIDDLNRIHELDLFIDYSFWKNTAYFDSKLNDDCVRLIGKKFIPLNPDFRHEIPKKKNFSRPNILISFGGYDNDGFTEMVIDSLSKIKTIKFGTIFIIVDKASEKRVKSFCNDLDQNVKIISSPNYLGKIYSDVDVCIGSSGVSSYERIFFEIPSLTFVKAKNQNETSENIILNGFAMALYNFSGDSIKKNILKFFNYQNLNKMNQNMKNFLDLEGSNRIASEIRSLIER